ncbi:MAG: AAA family ATPase [Planctomycetaceae bacterium]|nr:AAA family ATPase [Planctomycetaceae bacterium]
MDYLTVKGFRSIKSIERLELRPINVLVGANGSGKSNFVGVFAFLRDLRQGHLVAYTDAAGGAEKILHFGSKVTKEIELEIAFRDGINGYHVALSPTAEDRFYVHDERCWFWNKSQHPRPYFESLAGSGKEAGISEPQNRVPGWVQSSLDSWRLYHFHDTSNTSLMRKTADVDDNRFLRADASNLAAYLYLLRQAHQPEYQLIRKTIQRVAPFFDDFHLEPLRSNPSKVKLEWIHKFSDPFTAFDAYFDASSLSDGTLRFICLSTLFLQPLAFRPSTIIVDEPELGLHPYAITMLANLVRAAATETQVILSTQSALLLDHFQPEDVLVADLEQGATTLKRLQSQDLAVWLEEYSLGQLWEKNQFGGRPTRG